jgi:selenocysteine lyase/cysteine desulfurase
VDGIQALGQLPFSFRDLPVDFIAGASHKWMTGPLGQGFFAVKPELMKVLSPVLIGAGTYNRRGNFADPEAAMMDSAMRFEPGGLAFLPLFGMDSAIELLLETGMDQIESEISSLSSTLREGILSLGLNLVTPLRQKGGTTSIQMESELETRFLNRCRELKISIMKRGEVVRISPHAFCSQEEVQQVLQVLKEVIR